MEDSEWLNGLNLPGLDNAAISTNVKKTPRYVKQRKLTKYNIVSHTEKPPTQLLHTHQVDDNGNDCSLEYYFEEVCVLIYIPVMCVVLLNVCIASVDVRLWLIVCVCLCVG